MALLLKGNVWRITVNSTNVYTIIADTKEEASEKFTCINDEKIVSIVLAKKEE